MLQYDMRYTRAYYVFPVKGNIHHLTQYIKILVGYIILIYNINIRYIILIYLSSQ